MGVINAEVLIIDDNETDAVLMEETIKGLPHVQSVHVVHTGADGIRFLEKRDQFAEAPRPNLVILDLKMPDMDGHDVLTRVKANPDLAAIPVVVMSGSEKPEDVAKCYALHANCYITKPSNFIKFQKITAVIKDFWLGISALPPNTQN